MRAYLRGRDLVFQADNGFKVVGNLGLMAMRCNARVLRLWEVGRARAATAVSGMKPRPFPPPPRRVSGDARGGAQPNALALPAGGDQKLLNKLLYAPTGSGARYVRWGVLPWPELTTSTNEVTLGKHRLTGDGYLHHANDGGHKDAADGLRDEGARAARVARARQPDGALPLRAALGRLAPIGGLALGRPALEEFSSSTTPSATCAAGSEAL